MHPPVSIAIAKNAYRPPRQRRGRKRRVAPGAPPGTLVPDPESKRPILRLICYGPGELVETRLEDVGAVKDHLGRYPVLWLNVDGLGDAATLARIGEIFGLHPLALEDVLGRHQRAKIESYDQSLFVVAQILEPSEQLLLDQLAMFLGPNFVVTFQEREGDCFDPVRARIRKLESRMRESGPDYLAYALLDTAIDAYFPMIESLGERLEELEAEVLDKPDRGTIARIHTVKRDLLQLRRAVWPLREAMSSLLREANPLVKDGTRVFLRDCYDHTVQLMDLLENYRDIGSGLTDVYLSSISNRMNEIMKVLTIISTIFIPLSFIAGVYGMNFNTAASGWNMPELHWRLGYPFALAIMAATAGVLLLYFWRKGWLERNPDRASEDSR